MARESCEEEKKRAKLRLRSHYEAKDSRAEQNAERGLLRVGGRNKTQSMTNDCFPSENYIFLAEESLAQESLPLIIPCECGFYKVGAPKKEPSG
jgi:hypothetical protein